MKYFLTILFICFGTYTETAFCNNSSEENTTSEIFILQEQDPFYFITPVPPAKKLLENIDLSFFKNRLAVGTYRYRIQIPDGIETSIDRRLSIWSGWTSSDLANIKIPRLDLEGGYKLIVEYNPVDGNEIKRFEVPFYVYYSNPGRLTASSSQAAVKADESRPVLSNSNSSRQVNTVSRAVPGNTSGTSRSDEEAVERTNTSSRKRDPLTDLSEVKIETDIYPVVVSGPSLGSEFNPVTTDSLIAKNDYEFILSEAIDKEDPDMLIYSLMNGAGGGLTGPDGGNIYHLLAGNLIIDSVVSTIESMGFPVNYTNNNGNNPLHEAVIAGESDYVRLLVKHGADLNMENNMELSPLHLAVLNNNEAIVKLLLRNGADPNIRGNTGYTPLHIASELNFFNTAADLVFNGASTSLKTNQGLSPKMIAKIQGNNEMIKLLTKKDSSLVFTYLKVPDMASGINRSGMTGRPVEFNLPYDNVITKRRQLNKVIQYLAIPVFTVSAVLFISGKTKANSNYSMSKIAETENLAKVYYDKAVKYDRQSNISGGISLVSAYGGIHSTVRKRSLTHKMKKVFE